MSFKGASKEVKKAERRKLVEQLHRAKSYDDLDELVGGLWNGDEEMRNIETSIQLRATGVMYTLDSPPPRVIQNGPDDDLTESSNSRQDKEPITPLDEDALTGGATLFTPRDRENPEPAVSNAPLLPANARLIPLPAMIIGQDVPTPSPTPKPRA